LKRKEKKKIAMEVAKDVKKMQIKGTYERPRMPRVKNTK
jgi:hypothetical protein